MPEQATEEEQVVVFFGGLRLYQSYRSALLKLTTSFVWTEDNDSFRILRILGAEAQVGSGLSKEIGLERSLIALLAGVCGNRTPDLYASGRDRRDIWFFVGASGGLNHAAFVRNVQDHVSHSVLQFQNAVTQMSFWAGLSLCFLEYL